MSELERPMLYVIFILETLWCTYYSSFHFKSPTMKRIVRTYTLNTKWNIYHLFPSINTSFHFTIHFGDVIIIIIIIVSCFPFFLIFREMFLIFFFLQSTSTSISFHASFTFSYIFFYFSILNISHMVYVLHVK